MPYSGDARRRYEERRKTDPVLRARQRAHVAKYQAKKRAEREAYRLAHPKPAQPPKVRVRTPGRDSGRTRVREELWRLKAMAGCRDCGERDPRCLDFHHRDHTQKLFTIGDVIAVRKMPLILAEVEKCDVLCANCHRRISFEERHRQRRTVTSVVTLPLFAEQ